MQQIRGIDVSSVQGDIDFTVAKSQLDLSFCIVKCTQGNEPWHETDRERYDRYTGDARNVGLVIGAYHFLYPLDWKSPGTPLSRSPRAQAEFFYNASGGLGSQPGELPPAIDCEWPAPQDWARWGLTACDIVEHTLETLAETERLFSRKPMLYTYPWFWQAVGGAAHTQFVQYPLWMADYAYLPGKTLGPWAGPTIVQVSGGTGMRLPSGAPVDHNVYVGPDWTSFLNG